MKLFLFEGKKIFVKQFGFLFLLLAITAKIVSLTLSPAAISQGAADNADRVRPFYAQYSGKLTPETEAVADELYQEYVDIYQNLISLKNQVDAGEITPETFIAETDRLHEKKNDSSAFFLFYNQITYAKDNPEERWIVYPYGWASLLIPAKLDWILVFLLAVLSAPIFAQEYNTNTFAILFQGQHGRYKLFTVKMLLTVLTAALCAGVFLGIEYLFYAWKFSLPNGSYPLQSLPFFSESLIRGSLIDGWLLVIRSRILGAVLFAVSFQFFGVLTKNSLYTVFLGISAVILPYIVPILDSTKYILPTPLGLLLARGFLRPDQYMLIDSEKVAVFLAIPPETQRWIFIGAGGLLLVMIAFTLIRYCRIALPRKRIPSSAASLLIGVILCCAGCAADHDAEATPYNPVNLSTGGGIGWNGKIILNSPKFIVFDPSTNESSRGIKDAFLSTGDYERMRVYVSKYENDLYYLILDYESLTLYKVSDNTFEPERVYRRQLGGQNLFGNSDPYEEYSQYAVSARFFISGDWLTIVSMNNIEKINLKTKARKILVTDCSGASVGFDGEYIYYVTETYQIGKINFQDETVAVYPNIRSDNLFLANGKLYFRSIVQHNRPFAIDLATGEIEMVFDQEINFKFGCDERHFYFSNEILQSTDRSVYRYEFESGEIEKFSELELFNYIVLENSDYFLGYVFEKNIELPVLINTVTKTDRRIPLPY